MNNRLQEMRGLAEVEATKLKENATEFELMRLNIRKLKPDDTDSCIYGQLTGDCYSDRATELIMACCTQVYSASDEFGGIGARDRLNGRPFFTKDRIFKYHSPIEELIMYHNGGMEDANKIVNFLKGKTKTIKL